MLDASVRYAIAPCDGGFMYLWARAFGLTADEQARRSELARKKEEDARELAKASHAARTRQRLDTLWTLAGHSVVPCRRRRPATTRTGPPKRAAAST